MSEYINNRDKRIEQLLAFSRGIINGEDGKQLIERYREAIEQLTPHDLLAMEDRQLQLGISPAQIKQTIEKVINSFFKSLAQYSWQQPEDDSFLGHLLAENRGLIERMNQIKRVIKGYQQRQQEEYASLRQELLPLFEELRLFDAHYVKKENILFPYLETALEHHRPLAVMWSLHDDIRKTLKQLCALLSDPASEWHEFNGLMSSFFFLVYGMVQKENLVVYPIASDVLPADAWQAMYQQSFEYPFPFIETPEQKEIATPATPTTVVENRSAAIRSATGNLSVDQMLLMFDHLPVDITFVDEHDKVCFFNRAKDRFFPRSPAIIGRDVKNCHPPESVHIVEKIVAEFKNGKRDQADFRIKMRGRYILIQYFAVRDKHGTYRGVLEVSQDISETVRLEGEQRLLDWE